MNPLFFLRRYLYYLLFAHDEYHIHSPFVYEFYLSKIIKNDSQPSFKLIEDLRKKMLRDNTKIRICDYGSGSLINNNSLRTVRSISKHSLKAKKYAELLFRIIKHSNPKTAIELGTSLGITTLYQAISLKDDAIFYTFEGCPETAKIASQNIKSIKKNVKIIEGNIDITLSEVLRKIIKIDYAFFDANHRLEPTLRYFEQCVEKVQENSIFIFDDIHRSEEMEKAWIFIKGHKEVMLTIDLFHLGIVLFRKNQPKQHFMLKY